MHSKDYAYPFCAVVGQERAKRALMLYAVNPSLNGVLLAGETGTAKSLLVRGFATLLPERRQIYIPLHVDDDRLFGGMDTADAVHLGEKRFSPGLLASADGQMMAIDDVNLMSERMLKAILSTTENGGFETEREGISVWQSTSFLLLGTMNPEDVKLNPALLDRWGLYVRVENSANPSERMEIMRRRLAFERNSDEFVLSFETETAALRKKITQAQQRLCTVRIGEPMLRLAVEIVKESGCTGHRADILLAELARTLAAWEGQPEISSEHVREAAGFVLPHRMLAGDANGASGETSERETEREQTESDSNSIQQPKAPEQGIHSQQEEQQPGGELTDDVGEESAAAPDPNASGESGGSSRSDEVSTTAQVVVEAVGRGFDVRRIAFAPPNKRFQGKAGKRNHTSEGGRNGRYVRAEPPRRTLSDLALDATLRAAAPYQQLRAQRQVEDDGGRSRPHVLVERSDLRVKVRESRTGTALLFVVDASGSMNASKRMKAVKGRYCHCCVTPTGSETASAWSLSGTVEQNCCWTSRAVSNWPNAS